MVLRSAVRLLLLGVTPLLLAAAPAKALITLKVKQVGSDLVVTGSGSASTAALTAVSTDPAYTNVLTPIQVYAGPAAFTGVAPDVAVGLWSGLNGPASFSSESALFEYPDVAATNTGQLFGILTSANLSDIRLVLPLSYSSGASLSGTTTYTNLSLAQAGLAYGQVYTWTWGSNTAAETLRLEIGDTQSVPAPLPLAGAAAAFRTAQQLRRRSRHRDIPSPI